MQDLLIDCDTGQDDAIAIILAIASKKFNIVGITTVGGNANVENCTINTLKILELLNIDNISVYKGEQKPLYKELKTLECVFGESGMAGGDDLKVKKLKAENLPAYKFIEKTFKKINNIQVCATAPLTNFGKVFLKNDKISENINEITIMGGCPFPEPIRNEMGNITINNGIEKAEYNCWSDPEAFDIVLNSKIKNINIVGLNITRNLLYNHKYDKRLREINSTLSNRVADILSTIGEEDKIDYKNMKKFENDPVRAIHDVVAVAYIIDKTIFTTELLPLKVELFDKNKKGQTTINTSGRLTNIVTSVDKNKFFELIIDTIKSYK